MYQVSEIKEWHSGAEGNIAASRPVLSVCTLHVLPKVLWF